MHVHVVSGDGEAKFWMEPTVALTDHIGYGTQELTKLQKLVEEHRHEIARAWREHFRD